MTAAVDTSAARRLGFAIWPILLIAAVGQFEIAITLPSLPAMAKAFSTSTSTIQLTISAVYFGFGGVQLAAGPLVERFGRRGPAAAGLVVFVLATLVVSASHSVAALFAGRLVQGSGCALAIVAARSTARDRYDGAALARAMAAINIGSAVVSSLGTIAGGLLQDGAGWRAAFLAAAAVGGGVLLLALTAFPRSDRTEPGADAPGTRGYAEVFGSRVFIGAMAAAVAMEIGEFALLVSAPLIFEQQFGLSPSQFGFVPPLVLVAYNAGAVTAAALATRASDRSLVATGGALGFVSAAALIGLDVTGRASPASSIPAMMVFVLAVGLVVPPATAAAIRPFRHSAGPATAAMGALLILGVVVGSALASLHFGTPLLGAALTMLLAAVLTVASLFLLRQVANRC